MPLLASNLLWIFGVVHLVMSFVLFGPFYINIAQIGLGGGLSWGFEELTAFWFLVFSWPCILLGVICVGCLKRYGSLPHRRVLGITLILVPTLCGIWLPASGLWAFVLLGLLYLWNSPSTTKHQ